MIEEIFIVGDGDRVLYGDPGKYWKGARYPLDEAGGARLVQMAVNDVRIGVLYSLASDISMLGYIQRLKTKLERKLGEISEKSVLENYFVLFGMVNKQESVVLLDGKKSLIPSLVNSNVYLDVVEHSDVVADGERIVVNRTRGSCYLSGMLGEERVVRFGVRKPKSTRVMYKSDSQVSEGLEEIRVETSIGSLRAEALRYWVEGGDDPLVMVCKANGGYVLSCRQPTRFEHLEVCFPIPRMASKVVKNHRAGKSVYDEKDNLLRWTFSNEVVRRERIDYRVEMFEECSDSRPICISFRIKEWVDPKVRIERAECVGHPGVCFWIRHSIESGRYEIRG